MNKTVSVALQSIRIILSGYLMVSFVSWIFLILNNVFSGNGPDSAYNPLTPMALYLSGVSGLAYIAPITLAGFVVLILARTEMLTTKKSKKVLTIAAILVIAISSAITFFVLPGSGENAVSGKAIFLVALTTTALWVLTGILIDVLLNRRKPKQP